MSNEPEFLTLDSEVFYNGPALEAAGIGPDMWDEDRLSEYLDEGVAFEAEDDPNSAIVQYPSEEGGLAMLLRWDDEAYELLNAWPFLPEVVSTPAAPFRIGESAERDQAFVTCQVGGAALVYFEDSYLLTRDEYRAGEIEFAQFYAIGAQLRPASDGALEIGPDDPAYASLLESGSTPNASGNLEFSLAGAALMAPRFDIAPNAYEFRGPVVSVVPLNDWIVPDAAIARITVMRPFEDEEGQPDAEGLDLPILLRKPVLSGDDWPQPGEEVEGIIYVYGSGFAAPFDDDGEGGADAGVPILR
ncbi:hypothetical protein [Paracoccus xiamenensis]|uniref:hypothetical protein n=1 Tax=Paracoccus xiamenensis TaxID=2714901 RepID=UPI001409103E|nr:hypothetical protein [Paracoccus xiamenensis]NHF74734.1 hypothetical protein [Paracoccus xiamenensis]